jgi:hypothetical protein
VHVGSGFLAREEVKTKTTNPKNRRTHSTRIAQFEGNRAVQPDRRWTQQKTKGA